MEKLKDSDIKLIHIPENGDLRKANEFAHSFDNELSLTFEQISEIAKNTI